MAGLFIRKPVAHVRAEFETGELKRTFDLASGGTFNADIDFPFTCQKTTVTGGTGG